MVAESHEPVISRMKAFRLLTLLILLALRAHAADIRIAEPPEVVAAKGATKPGGEIKPKRKRDAAN